MLDGIFKCTQADFGVSSFLQPYEHQIRDKICMFLTANKSKTDLPVLFIAPASGSTLRWLYRHAKSLLREPSCWWLFCLFVLIYEITHHWYVICFCKVMKQTRCNETVPKKSLIESCDTWPGVLMSVWVLPQSKHKFMPKSRVPRAHPSKTHRGSTWEKTQTAIKALNLEGQRSVPDLATHTLHCFTFISQYNTSQQPWKEWKDIFEGCARAQILWQQCDKRS